MSKLGAFVAIFAVTAQNVAKDFNSIFSYLISFGKVALKKKKIKKKREKKRGKSVRK